MINLDTIIKIVRTRGYKDTWPEQTRYILSRLEEIKSGFPGIRNDHLSIIPYNKILEGDIFIYDSYLEKEPRLYDDSPIMLKLLPNNLFYVEGIGRGLDLVRDPRRELIKWRDTISFSVPMDSLVLRVDVRPTLNGGPGYYYFFRSYRDYRI